FTYQTGASIPAGASVFFNSSDGTINVDLTTAGAVSSNATWLAVAPSNKALSVTVDPTGLSGGVYSANVTVAQAGAANSPMTFPVVLVVNGGIGGGGGTGGALTFSSNSLAFSATAGNNPA